MKNNNDTLRPIEILRGLESQFPKDFWKFVESNVKLPPHELTTGHWLKIIKIPEGMEKGLDVLRQAATFAAIGRWRLTKGIYRFDQDLMRELANTPAPIDAPTEIFKRLPEPCVYVEMQGYQGVEGYFAFVEGNCLTILIDINIGLLIPIFIHMEYKNVKEAFASYEKIDATSMKELIYKTKGIFSTLLYLCSDEPDYNDHLPPSPPLPKKVKGGHKWIPKQNPQRWDVGVRIGAAIRKYGSSYDVEANPGEESTRTVRPHIRRAHWHGFWTGPRKEPGIRKYIHRWIPPTPINLPPGEELPAVIRPVKGE